MFNLRQSFIHFAKIASTGFFVQIVSFLFYPLIGRIFSPEEFGVFSFFSSLSLCTGIFITGQLHNASINPDDDFEALQLISMSLWMTFFSSVAFLVVVIFLISINKLSLMWLLFPLYLVSLTSYEVIKLIPIRQKNYDILNSSQIINRISSNVLKVTRPFSLGSAWLIISEVLCNFAASFYVAFKFKFIPLMPAQIPWKKVLKKYSKFPLFQTPSIFIQLIITEFPSYYFKLKGDEISLGYYAMGNRIFVQPFLLLGSSLHPILIHRFKLNAQNQFKTVLKLMSVLAFVSSFMFIILMFFHKNIIALMLGSRWENGTYIYELQIWLVLTKLFIGTILSYLISRDKSHYLFLIKGLELLLILISLNFLEKQFIQAYVCLELLADFILIMIVLKSSSINSK